MCWFSAAISKMLIPVGLRVWVLLVCFSGVTGDLNCDHCLYGPEYCHSETDRCLYGCSAGWTGEDCNINCTIPSCIHCELTPLGQECLRCKTGWYGRYCNNSCSLYCKYGETHCDREGKCNYGCERGWVGDHCNRRECAFNNCQSCETWSNGLTYCKSCEVGYYWDGVVCRECSPQCVGGRNSCNTSTGACLIGCVDNWIGANCDLQCKIEQCLQCSTVLDPYRAVCTQCQIGYFLQDGMCVRCGQCRNGEACDNVNGTCQNGCVDRYQGDKCNLLCDIQNCEKCKAIDFNRTVCEICERGYYYSSPDTCRPCNFSCAGGPQKCDPRTGKCTDGCFVGYYGEFCNYTCSKHCINTCSSLNGHCDCEQGWFGRRCDRECPVNCDDCVGFAVSNTCSRCQQGWYGPHCETACPENCLQEPYRDRCDKVTGQCNMGCYGSMYGKFCNETCSPNCIGTCDQHSGNCSSGCVSSWYGPTCDQKCSLSCKDAPSGFRICDRDDGTCYYGCENGKYGQTCEKTCSYNCRSQTCVMTSGECVACMKGFYGKNCSQQCEGHCMESECDQSSGICVQGCAPGYFGTKCDQVCSKNCIDYKCEQNTGHCVKGCLDGFYGSTCLQLCYKNCLNNTCQQSMGLCDQGCKAGYMGTTCVQGCPPGLYGENCEKSCGQCVNDGPCLPTSGKCPQGCAVGWGKDTCDSKLQYGGTVEETTSLPITIQAGISAAAVIFLFLLGVAIFVVYKRRHHKHVKKERDSMTVTYSGEGYSSQAVIHTRSPTSYSGSECFDSSNAARKISFDHAHIYHSITQVDMATSTRAQSVDRSQQSGIQIGNRDDKKSEDKTQGSSSAFSSNNVNRLIDRVDGDKDNSEEVVKRQNERISKLKKQGIPVETYLRISTPTNIIQSTCSTDNGACGGGDNSGDGAKSKETECGQNIESGVRSGVFETQGLDLSVMGAEFSASTVKDAILRSVENSISIKHTTVMGAEYSIPVLNTTNSRTGHFTPVKDLAKRHKENSTEERKEIDFSVKSAGWSTPIVCIPITGAKCLKPQKDDIGKGTDYSVLDYTVQSSGHITPNQITPVDTRSTRCDTPQHGNNERTTIHSELELNNSIDSVKCTKSVKDTNVECSLNSTYDMDITDRSTGCPVSDMDTSVKSAGYSTSDTDMSVKSAECLTPDMDMSVRSPGYATLDEDISIQDVDYPVIIGMDISVKSKKYHLPEANITVKNARVSLIEKDNIFKKPKDSTSGKNTGIKSEEYETCEDYDSHSKCNPGHTYSSEMSKPDMPEYFGSDSEVPVKSFMPESGGSFGNKDVRDYVNSAYGEFLDNKNRVSQIRSIDSGNSLGMLDSKNISGQLDSSSSESLETSNRLLENRIMQALRSDLIRGFFKFSNDIAIYEDLQTFLRQNELHLHSNRLYQFSVNICTGLNYLHQQKILHRLLRAKSIYMDEKMVTKIGDLEWAQQADDIKMVTKIGDLECAQQADDISSTDQEVTLPEDYHRWMSPESLLYSKFSLRSDVWSFGLVLWEIFNLGLEPFTSIEPDKLKMRLQEGLRPKKPRNCDLRLYRVMKTCWRYAGEDRPSVESLLSQLSSLMKSQNPIANGEVFV